MPDLSVMTASDYADIPIGDRTFRVGPLKLEDFGALQAWLKANSVPPVVLALRELEKARAAGIDVGFENRQYLLDKATVDARTWPPTVMSQAWFDLLDDTPGGYAEWLRVILAKHDPAVTAADAAALVKQLDLRTRIRLISWSWLGAEPPAFHAAEGGAEVPKSRGPRKGRKARTTGAKPSTASPRSSGGATRGSAD